MARWFKNPPAKQEAWVEPWVGRSPGKGNGYPLQRDLPGKSHGQRILAVKEVRWDPATEVKVKGTQSCQTHCDPMDYTVHGILQARILEWVAFPSSRGSSQPRGQTQVSWIAGDSLPAEPQGKPISNWACMQKAFWQPATVFTYKLVTINSTQIVNISMSETQKLISLSADCKSYCLWTTHPRLAVHSTGDLGKMGHTLTAWLQAARWPPLGYPVKPHAVSNDKKQWSL